MEKQYKDSITNTSGYKANTPIGAYEESPELSKEYTEINRAFEVADVPTSENSKRKTDSSKLSASQDAPGKLGNSSC